MVTQRWPISRGNVSGHDQAGLFGTDIAASASPSPTREAQQTAGAADTLRCCCPASEGVYPPRGRGVAAASGLALTAAGASAGVPLPLAAAV